MKRIAALLIAVALLAWASPSGAAQTALPSEVHVVFVVENHVDSWVPVRIMAGRYVNLRADAYPKGETRWTWVLPVTSSAIGGQVNIREDFFDHRITVDGYDFAFYVNIHSNGTVDGTCDLPCALDTDSRRYGFFYSTPRRGVTFDATGRAALEFRFVVAPREWNVPPKT